MSSDRLRPFFSAQPTPEAAWIADLMRYLAWLLERIGEQEEFDFIAEFAGPLPAITRKKYDCAETATREMAQLFREFIVARRAHLRYDILSELAAVEEGGDRLADDELMATCVLLLFAGQKTTTHHLANGLLVLLRFPGERLFLFVNAADPVGLRGMKAMHVRASK